MINNLQLEFRLRLPACRPLIPLECVMVLANLHEDSVLAEIEAGGIAWAWDIRARDAERREIRVWRQSLLKLLGDSQASEIEDPLMAIFPPARGGFSTGELQRLCSCSATHIYSLAATEKFHLVRGPRRGPNGAMEISRESLITFLQARRIGAPVENGYKK